MNFVQKEKCRTYEGKKENPAVDRLPGVGGGLQCAAAGDTGLSGYLTALNLLLSAVVFAVFQHFIFGRLVKKHSRRIAAYVDEKQFFWNFFDLKSFAIMAFMMTGGIWLRSSGLAPQRFIAVFYSGLGASLLLAGILFGRNYISSTMENES